MNAHDMSIHGTARRELPDIQPSERALLGTLIMSPNAIDRIPKWFDAGYFVVDAHSVIFDKVVELVRAGGFANPVLIKGALPDEKIGNKSVSTYISELCGEAIGEMVVPSLCAAIYQHWKRRARILTAQLLAQSAYDDLLDIPERTDELRAAFERTIENREKEAAALRPGDAYIETFNASARRDGVVGVPIAMPEIAKVLSEPVFEAGNLYGLLSSSGEGKSSLTMQLIYHAVEQGHPVLFLSYDQSASQCVRQMIAQVHGIDIRQQRDPSRMMSPSEQETCVHFAMKIDRQPLDIIRCQREGVTQLVAYARRFIKKHGNGRTPFIVIDHIGKVKPRDPKLSADRISGDITVELKALADETGSAVLVLNQRNGFGDKRDNPRPIAADLYGGAGARADYDAVMYLYRAEKYKAEREKIAASDADWKRINRVFASDIAGIAEIGSIKVRFGDPTITETLKFIARYTKYESMKAPVSQERMF